MANKFTVPARPRTSTGTGTGTPGARMLAAAAVLAVLAQALPPAAVAAPVSAPHLTSNASPASPSAPSTAVDEAMQRDLHLSIEQIRVRQAREATAPDLEESMRAKLGERYAGTWLSREGTLYIGATDGRDAATVGKAGATIQTVRYSERQLLAFKEALDRRGKAVPPGVYSWYIDLPANKVIVSAQAGQSAAAQAFGAEAGVESRALQVVTVAERPHPLSDLPGGEAFYMGGSRCSIGFAVVGGVVTAGHCNVSSQLTGPDHATKLGTWSGTSFPENDYAWITTTSSYNPVPEAKGLGSVAGSREAVIGTSVCRSGARTGVHCGYITHKNMSVTYGDDDLVKGLTLTNACAEPGDSGGPFMARDQAQGVTSGGNGNCTTGGETYFQPVNEILSTYGLTLKTGPSAPLWWTQSPHNSERATIHIDVNGDNREDVATFYNYYNNQTKLWVFLANGTGGFDQPVERWDSGPGGWDLSRTRFAAGDFDGDHRDDIAALYDYGNNGVGVWIFRAKGNGEFNKPIESGNALPGTWDLSRTRLVSGDVNGDGRHDLSAFYDYGSSHAALFVYLADTTGRLGAPTVHWESFGNWNASRARLVAGDVNGDGKDDISAFYDSDANQTMLWVFLADSNGRYGSPTVRWASGRGNWDVNATRAVAGDVNGDRKDDITAFYDYNNGQTALFVFLANGTGGFYDPVVRWQSNPGTWDLKRTRLVAGDFDGDGNTDVGAFYDYYNSETRLWVFRANGAGGFDWPIPKWESPPGTWTYDMTAPI